MRTGDFILSFKNFDRNNHLCKRISRYVEIDKMFSRSFYMRFIWEFDVSFFKRDSIFLSHAWDDFMLRESSKYFCSFSFERKFESLSIEHFLYFKRFFEFHTSHFFCSFFILFDFFQSFCIYLACESFWDKRIASLTRRDLDNFSSSPDMSDILEKFDGELWGSHMTTISENPNSSRKVLFFTIHFREIFPIRQKSHFKVENRIDSFSHRKFLSIY